MNASFLNARRFNPGGMPGPHSGMFMDPSHPMFTQPRPPFGGPNRLPPGAVPPGARFDPITPLGPRPGFPMRPPGRPGFRPPGVWRYAFLDLLLTQKVANLIQMNCLLRVITTCTCSALFCPF